MKTTRSWTGKVPIKQNPAYTCYAQAKQRCNNPNATSYKNYGARGIKFLYSTFNEFISDVGERPSKLHTLDRIDNNGNYEIGNVKWATWEEQVKSRRPRSDTKTGLIGVHLKSGRTSFIAYSNNKALYIGPDFFEACCIRKHWEQHREII